MKGQTPGQPILGLHVTLIKPWTRPHALGALSTSSLQLGAGEADACYQGKAWKVPRAKHIFLNPPDTESAAKITAVCVVKVYHR